MSKAREALDKIRLFDDIRLKDIFTPDNNIKSELDLMQVLADRDEPKQVIREHHLRAWGTCPVCKVNVGLPFHIKFCGTCGIRLVWEGEKK